MACCNKPRKKSGQRFSVTIEKPVTSGADAYDQINIHDDAGWETHATRTGWIRSASIRESFVDEETIAAETLVVGFWGDSTTRQLSSTYRLKYTDEDSVTHRLGIVGRQLYDLGKWVECRCVEERL